jgi:hypothetical protein
MDRDEQSPRFEIECRIRDLREGIQALESNMIVDDDLVRELMELVEEIEANCRAVIDR